MEEFINVYEGCYCDRGWVCEIHTTKPMGHDGCGGTGMPCMNAKTPHGQRNIQEHLEQLDETHTRYGRTFESAGLRRPGPIKEPRKKPAKNG